MVRLAGSLVGEGGERERENCRDFGVVCDWLLFATGFSVCCLLTVFFYYYFRTSTSCTSSPRGFIISSFIRQKFLKKFFAQLPINFQHFLLA